ncbi:MAG: iron hydrogenase, partial [Blautia massiliensis (ex Durand et al. 2017)]
MRNYDTPVRAIRHKVFAEVAKAGFESSDETLIHDIEAIPYNIVEEKAKYRESIYRERAVASERVRLAMGLSLRPENKAVHLTDGLAASNINEKYYEPPLMQVIPSACDA